MTLHRWTTITASLAAAGGLCWLAKLAVIAITDGRVTDSGAAAVFYLGGAVLLVLGASCVALRVLRPHRTLLIAAVLALAPLIFFLTFIALESLAKPVVGDAGPAWLADEAGILLTGIVWLATGIALLREPRPALAA